MISVLTITNGNRWKFLQQVLKQVSNDSLVKNILVVNNAVPYDLEKAVASLETGKIKIINLDKNYGSAGAFKIGLQFLSKQEETEFILLLDDDNMPSEGTTELLYQQWKLWSMRGKEKKLAFLSLRADRVYLQNVMYGGSVIKNFPRRNLFLGFGILEAPSIFFDKLFKKLKRFPDRKLDKVKIPMAPFGGLFFHKELLKVIGFPDERFFLYVDDFEFTYRITKTGGEIWLLTKCVINDIDLTWINKTRHGFFKSRYLQQGDFKSYVSVRNFTFFARNNLAINSFFFQLNIKIYLSYLFILAIFSRRLNAYKLFRQAVNDGLSGNFNRQI